MQTSLHVYTCASSACVKRFTYRLLCVPTARGESIPFWSWTKGVRLRRDYVRKRGDSW